MRRTITTAIPVFAACLVLLNFAGCAEQGQSRFAREQGPKCPPSHTMTCEVRKIGRIHHGTFQKNYDSCSCVPNSIAQQTIPVIP